MKIPKILIYKISSNLLLPLHSSQKTKFEYIENDSNNNYSTLFTCLVAPIFLCVMHINWSLYPLAFFKVIWCIVPDIITNNLIIFIYMTISNIITIYIACLSISINTNLKENIIYFFNNLKKKYI
jgi:hypothetical protein